MPREEERNADNNRLFLKAPKISHFGHVGIIQYHGSKA